ncbi:MAG: DUF6174 domain-containing protein [Solirubrobacteraceae bacterium]
MRAAERARTVEPMFYNHIRRGAPDAPARRLTFTTRALAVSAAGVLLLTGASSAMAQTPSPAGAVDPDIANGTAQQQLDGARQRWQAAHISDYHYTVERVCFCVPSFRGPATIVVRDDAPLDPPASFEDVATIPKLHAIVQQAIDDRVERLGVTYDALGVPQSISIDPRLMIADDEITYRITGFTVDPRSRLLVAFHRTGGLIGVDDRLSVARDGLAIRTARDGVPHEFHLSAADLTELNAVLEAADFPSLKPVYRPPFPVSDGFTYTLTYRSKTVEASEGAIPPALEAPIAVLSRLFDGSSA